MAHSIRSSPLLRQLLESWTPRIPSLSTYRQLPKEDSESLLEHEKGEPELPVRARWRNFRHVRVRRYVAFVGVAASLLLLLALAFSKRAATNKAHGPIEQNAQALHLLIPSPDLSPELCKTSLSAEVLQYSPPTLVQWHPVGNHVQANTRRRMTAVRNYLEKLATQKGNDTVVLMDSVSTWFQLRPEVLLNRYYNINRSGDKRLVSSMGMETVEVQGMRQSIVFPASSTCGAMAMTDRGCHAIPESPLSRGTSQMNAPQYLARGVKVGPAKDLYELYRRAVAIIERSQDFEDELQVFTEIFGQQEYRRSLLHRQPQSWLQRFGGLFAGKNPEPQIHEDNPDEFSIGLDYLGELSLSTETGPESFTWSKHKNLPSDIMSSMPPFWATSDQILPSGKTWKDLNLLTNSHTHSIPAIIQQNTSATHDLNKSQWANLWLQPYARKLLDAHMFIPTMPLTSVRDGKNVEQVFWSTTIDEKAGAKVAEGPWLGWDRLCPGEELAEEVFRDGKGEWRNPLP